LTWRNHIDYIYNKLKQLTGIFYRLRSKLAYRWLQNVYYAFVYPYLLYGIEIYANTYASYLDKLGKINNKILRILLNQSVCTLVPQLYEMFGLLPIEKLYSFQVLLLVFKCVHCSHLVPSVYVDPFVINSEMHNYNTRSSQKLHLFNTRTTYGQICIKYKGSSL